MHSTAAKAGFITGLAVVLVPVLGAVFFGRRPHFAVYIFAGVAAAGLGFLSLDLSAGLRLHPGDGLLLSAPLPLPSTFCSWPGMPRAAGCLC